MELSDFYVLAAPGIRTEWFEIKDRVDLAAVATNLMGPATKRQGPANSGLARSMMTMTQASRLI